MSTFNNFTTTVLFSDFSAENWDVLVKAHEIQDVEAGANELHLELDVNRSPSLDDIGDKDPNNHILSWADITDLGSHQQAMMITAILNNRDQYGNSDCKDTKT